MIKKFLAVLLIASLSFFSGKKQASPVVLHTTTDTLIKSVPPVLVFTMSGGTFDVSMGVIITKNIKAAVEIVNLNLPDNQVSEADFDVRGVVFYEDSYSPIMWLPEIPKTIEDYSVANHEIFHLVRRVLTWAGVPLSDDTEEVWAFEVQLISQQFYQQIKKYETTKN